MNEKPVCPYDTFSSRPLWQKVALVAGAWPLLIAWRCLWQYHPGLPACLFFWMCDLTIIWILWTEMSGRRKWLYFVADVGAVMNALATIANAGHMPVSGSNHHLAEHSVWIPATPSTNLYFLCDIHGGASFGDLLIFTGILALITNWICEQCGWIDRESRYNRRMTFGIG